MFTTGTRGVLGELGEPLLGAGAQADRGDVAREHERGVAHRLAARELELVRAQHHRVAAELDDARLERRRACGSTGARTAARPCGPRARASAARRRLQRQRAVEQRRELGAAMSSVPSRKCRRAKCTVRGVRVLTWNLFHGRSRPPSGGRCCASSRARSPGWEWDVALLQEVPPWWPAPLAAAAGARGAHAAHLAQPAAAAAAGDPARNPDLLKSSGGGANAILVRGEPILEHRAARLRRWPERRWVHGVRLPARAGS